MSAPIAANHVVCTCGKAFANWSALFAHAESDALFVAAGFVPADLPQTVVLAALTIIRSAREAA